MSKHFQYFLLSLLIIGIILPGCGSRNISDSDSDSDEKYILIKDYEPQPFTNDQLKNFMNQSDSFVPSIVVRSSGSTGNISSTSSSDRICSLLEMALAKSSGFDVRDRSIFESAVLSHQRVSISNKADSVYLKLYEATGVDLLMEVTNYSLNDEYPVTGYYDKKGKFREFDTINEGTEKDPRMVHPRYIFRGMSLTIKVIILKDNLVGGSYSYYYVPCAESKGGAVITQMYPLRYWVPYESSRDLEAVLDDERGARYMERNQRLDRAMENFISEEVIPGIVNDMKKGDKKADYLTEEMEYRSYSSNNHNGRYSLSSLLESYEIQEILDRYQKAVSSKNKRLADNIESDLWEIEREVDNNPVIPKSVKKEFAQYIEAEEDEIKESAMYNSNSEKKGKRSFIKNTSTTNKRVEEKSSRYSNDKIKQNGIKESLSDDEYTLESLLKVYEVQIKLDNYKEAISNKDKKRASAIEDELWKIEKLVEDNNRIPESVREDFCEYIESAEDDIERNSKKSSKKAKNQQVETIVNTDVTPVNSFGKISSAIEKMIEVKLDEKIAAQKAKVMTNNSSEVIKLQSELSQLKNDYDKWYYLDYDAINEINQFVSTTTFAAGIECPSTESNHVSFYLPMMKEVTDADEVIYLFLDGKCIGVGTNRKGFFVDIDNSDNSSTFRQLSIYGAIPLRNGSIEKKQLFESLIRFDLRHLFIFEREMSKVQLKKLKLQ